MKNKLMLYFILAAVLFVAACNNDSADSVGSYAEYEAEEAVTAELEIENETATTIKGENNLGNMDYYEEFITTKRIHNDMSKFTFIRRLGNYVSSPQYTDVERYVSIVIKDEDGNIVQELNGLTQGGRQGWMTADHLHFSIRFNDLNFDGYMDMWLISHAGSGSLIDIAAYFWLWDPQSGQFVLNNQLSEMAATGRFSVEYETQHVVTSRLGNRYINHVLVSDWHQRFYYYFEYINGQYMLAYTSERIFESNDAGGWQWTNTCLNIQTGEIDVEIIPSDSYGQPLVDPGTEFVTTIRIHPDMPEFTITRIVGDYVPYEALADDFFPQPREVRIIIADENGVVIQEINDLTQSSRSVSGGLSFDDYNFDGYLDMRLLRWQDSAGGLLAHEYFWLWNTSIMQFVMHEQLTAIGHAAWLGTDQENQRIYVGNRYRGGHALLWYEYSDGWFSVVHRAFTRSFDAPSGERFVATMSARLLPDILQNVNVYEVDITIEAIGEEREILQEILGIGSNYKNPPSFSWQPDSNSFNPLNFDIVYLAGGNIIMSLRLGPGGSMMNDPHYFWMWDIDSRQFVEHMGLRDLSDFGTVSFGHNNWLDVGHIHSVYRVSHEWYIWSSYDFIDGKLVPLQTRERVMDFDGENWRIKHTIHDLVNDTTRIEFEAYD